MTQSAGLNQNRLTPQRRKERLRIYISWFNTKKASGFLCDFASLESEANGREIKAFYVV